MTYGTGIYDLNKFQELRDSFLTGKKPFKFDLMKIPFNDGNGGKPDMIKGASQNNKSNYFPKVSPDGKWMVFCQADNYMLLQPDSKLYIVPTDGSAEPRLMNCNTSSMNSWHSWSPNGRWLVFSSKIMGPYTQLFLTHIDKHGNDSPPVWLEYLKVNERAANIPEFVNVNFNEFNKIVDEFSDVADYNVRGTSKAQFGDFKEAIIDFNKALQVNPKDDQAFANRGKAKDELGVLQGALADLSKAIELNPGEHDYYIHRGNTKMKLKDVKGAIEDCKMAININPEDAALYAHLSGIYQLSLQFNLAIEYLSNAIKLKPDYVLYYTSRANLYLDINVYEKAIADINKAIKIEPSNSKILTQKGIIQRKNGDVQKAIESFNKAIKINPDFSKPYAELGVIYDNSNKFEDAVNNFSKAIASYDKEAKRELAALYNHRGTIYGKINDFDKAVRDFDQAIALRSTFIDAYSNRAYAKYSLGHKEAALMDCNIALQINPDFKKALLVKDMISRN